MRCLVAIPVYFHCHHGAGKNERAAENYHMGDTTIEQLMKLVHRASSYNDFLERVRTATGIGRAEKTVSYEFGTLQEFYHWVQANVAVEPLDDFDGREDSVSIRGTMPGKKGRSPHHETRLNEIKAACEDLRDRLARALVELQELAGVTVPGLQTLYTEKLGPLELELFTLQCRNSRKKRRIELLQDSLEQNLHPDIQLLETALDREFSQWEEQRAQQEKALKTLKEKPLMLNSREAGEFRKLFRILLRRLHPDINPVQSEEERKLWFSLQGSYEKSDMEMLRSVAASLEETPRKPLLPGNSSIEAWERARGEIARKISIMEAEIRQIQSSHPYTLRDQLHDEKWLGDRLAQLRSLVKEEKELSLILDAREASLTDAHGRE